MKVFIDSGDIAEIKEAQSMGVIDGVTTNPSLLAKAGKPTKQAIAEICEVVDGPISAEVVATDVEGMVREGRHWAALHPNIVVKCPCTVDGLKATKALTALGHRVNMTLIFSPTQALLAAKAGARFVSPFVGRLDDISTSGMAMVGEIVNILGNYDYDCEVLAASLRHPMHVVEAARVGAHIGTMPFTVFQSLVKHPLTDIGLKKFLDDWEKAKKELGAKAAR